MGNRSTLDFEGFRCIVNCDLDDVEDVEISEIPLPWSDPTSWPSGEIPVEGEDVVIERAMNIIFDLQDSPLLKSLTINGRLSFLNLADEAGNHTLHSYWIFVRAGELLIGDNLTAYNGNATIKLYGAVDEESFAFAPAIEAGNKFLAVVGMAHLYGEQRDQMSRLKATALKGHTSVLVESQLDWRVGDSIVFLPTAIQENHFDYRIIESYDSSTGELNVTLPLTFYHWGQRTSTEADYNGVDMRGEVVLLSRNVRIVGNDSDSWGGQVIVSDSLEASGAYRTGQIIFDGVEIYNCS